MKRTFLILAAVTFFGITVSLAGAQTAPAPTAAAGSSGSTGEQTIEELYLKNVAMRVVREQATDLSRDSKLLALASIREMINSGGVTKDSAVALDVLGYLANEGTAREVMENNQQINNFPEVRRQACNLLGQIGGQQADEILMQVMMQDSEPMVLSEAAYALGQIGLNKDGLVSKRIADVVIRQTVVKPDNNFAFASLLAFEKLAKKNNGLQDPTSFQAIVAISQGSYITAVKEKALQVLDELKKYG
ncbi:MAG TPA: HEAT repeat domain-containing protein [Spirochaetia bacterium]|nr:HEAT repeat domain-containing protein [Spirochaetia bacterium]